MPFCRKCGSGTAEEDLFCERCGTSLRSEAREDARESGDKAPRKQSHLVGILVIIVIALLAVLYHYSANPVLQTTPPPSKQTPEPPKTESEAIFNEIVTVTPGKTTNTSFKMSSISDHEKNVRLEVYVSQGYQSCEGAKELRLYRGSELVETDTPNIGYNTVISDPGFETYTLSFIGGRGYIPTSDPQVVIGCGESKYRVEVIKRYEIATD